MAATILGIAIVCVALLVIYYVLLTRVVLEMLQRDANPILMTFAFLALIPLPPLLILGIVVMVLWSNYRDTAPAV